MTDVTSGDRLADKELAVWLFDRLAPDSGVLKVAIAFGSPVRLRWWPLQAALAQLQRRHPALRTLFPERDGVPVREVLDADDERAAIELETVPVEGGRLDSQIEEILGRPFDVREEPAIRAVHLVGTGDGPGASDDVICLVVHHLAVDAVSGAVIGDEFVRLYKHFAVSTEPPPDLADEVPAFREPSPSAEDVGYWRERLAGASETARELELLSRQPEQKTYAGGQVSVVMAEPTARALASLGRRVGVTENIALYAVYSLLLSRHGVGKDAVIGVPVDTRGNDHRGSVGYHVSTLPLRLGVDPASSVRALLRAARDAFLSGVLHSGAGVDDVFPGSYERTGRWRRPLFRHMFNYRPTARFDEARDAGFEPLDIPIGHSRMDLELVVMPGERRTVLRLIYADELHDEAQAQALLDRFEALIVHCADHVDEPVGRVPLWSERDRALVAAANATANTAAPEHVAHQVLAQAMREENAIAVRTDGDTGPGLDYGGLLRAAGRLAGRLRAAGVGTGDVVGLLLGAGPSFCAAALACWEADAAWLPLAPDDPVARLTFELDDSGCHVLLADTEPAPEVGADRTVLRLDTAADPEPDGPLPRFGGGEDTAYVLYTSGSTGTPKGVRVPHRALANVVHHFASRLGVGPGDRTLWLTVPTFDIAALEWLLPLTTGGCAMVGPAQARTDGTVLREVLSRNDIRVVQATPTVWRRVLATVAPAVRGRTVLCGGEPMSPTLATDLLAAGCTAFNVYGPTETTIWSTAAELRPDSARRPSVGVPIDNTTVFVARPDGEEAVPGLWGELCIAGRGVATSYLNRPDLTAERFSTHPTHGRYYRTGDTARWGFDGTLYLAGRMDRQIKLRGHRIELDEVEAALRSHPSVDAAAVVATDDLSSDGTLVAFVVASDGSLDADALWRHGRDLLPDAAVPGDVVFVPELPVTSHGKVDYRALHRRGAQTVAAIGTPKPTESPEPSEDGHRRLVELLLPIWATLLARPGTGPDSNFFLSGGNSLKAAMLIAKVHRATGVKLTLRHVLDQPTPRLLATHLATTLATA